MSFSDPETITVNAVAQSLKRVGSGLNAGTLRTNDGNFVVDVAHSYNKGRARHTVAIKQRKISADPVLPSTNTEFTQTIRITADVPNNTGFTVAEQKLLVDGFLTWLTATSGAKMTQLLGGES